MGRILFDEQGRLAIAFEYQGRWCEEPTAYPANDENAAYVRELLRRIEADITNGTFSYGLTFPSSPNAVLRENVTPPPVSAPMIPTLEAFAETWYAQMSLAWKPSNRESILCVLRAIVPILGDRPVNSIGRAELLEFRAEIMRTRRGRMDNKTIGNRRANRIMTVLQSILREASLQLGFADPTVAVKPLKEPRTDIRPFTIEEIGKLLAATPPHYKDYVLVRCLTGLRSGEINGLQWDQVDLERRQIHVREARVRGIQVLPKSEYGDRDVPMSQPVYEAIRRQQDRTGDLGGFVFLTRRGSPINTNNFSNRDWPKIMRRCGLKMRRPYQTRHTAATLMLASGENPEWIAKTLGHADCEMLWKVYSRYVPNMTRQDGSALDAVLKGRLGKVAGGAA